MKCNVNTAPFKNAPFARPMAKCALKPVIKTRVNTWKLKQIISAKKLRYRDRIGRGYCELISTKRSRNEMNVNMPP